MVALRVLMVSHVPLVRTLGAGRVQLELADELRTLGHDVETFDVRATRGGFPRAARRHVQSVGRQFDVVDAHHGNLPYSKRSLGFDGLLVARTAGLYAFYVDFRRFEERKWPRLVPGNRVAHLRRRIGDRRRARTHDASLEAADLLLPLTAAEADSIRTRLRIDTPAVVIPNGLPSGAADALAAEALPVADRLAACQVVAVGTWDLRKGAADWPHIIRRTRDLVPHARFRFLGTWADADVVLHALGDPDGVDVVSAYEPDELPALLADATVGALASYAEGWGLGLLESLAAGLPCVAYDASGPRAMLEAGLVPVGDADALAASIIQVLQASPVTYEELSAQSRSTAARYLWPELALQTVAAYERGLAVLR